jgi:hypothetical protein
MDPLDPLDAQQIVAEYATLLVRDVTENRLPASVESLPYAKPIIKSAFATSTRTLSASGLLTDELREYLETAYTLLAEYLTSELVEFVTQYRGSADRLTVEAPRDRAATDAWKELRQTSGLAGEIARATSEEVEALRAEFRTFTV